MVMLIVFVINLMGGDVFDVFVIYNVVCWYSGKVMGCVDGVVVLVVLLILMVCDMIEMLLNVRLMIYNLNMVVVGEVDDLCKFVDLLDSMFDSMLVVYVECSG